MSPVLSMNLREQSSLIYKILLLIDCSLSTLFLWVLVQWHNVPWSPYYTRLEILVFILSFFSFQSFQLYRSWRGWRFYREFLVILQAWASVIGVLLCYFFFFKISEAYSRIVFMIWSAATPFLIFFAHFIVRRILRYLRKRGKNIRHAVVVGASDLGLRLVYQVESIPWAGIEVIGFFDDKTEVGKELQRMDKPILGRISEVKKYLQVNDIDYVYVALPMRAERKIFRILRECRDLGAQIFLVPDLYIFGLHHAEIQSLGDMLILNFNPATAWKRTFDIIFSCSILFFTAPLLLVIALLIKVGDGGPVFYRHKRITAAGREFECIKFRTMCVGADEKLEKILSKDEQLQEEWSRTFKLKNDPRITRIGRFLRRTSLDEFPQFFNVLKGEMSVVGARPIVGKELHGYYKGNSTESVGRYCSMKPGITGPWQVMKRSDIGDYKERVELDDWYVLNFSLKNDLKIIYKTVLCMLSGKGAY